MTRDQLHIAFKIAMDKNAASIAFGGCPAFLDEEIDYWLNLGMYLEISNKFTGLNTLRQPFEQSVKRIHDLENLICVQNLIEVNKEDSYNECVAMNALADKLFFVECDFRWGNKVSNVTLVDHLDAGKFRQTYDNVPYIATPVAVIENHDIRIFFDPISMKSDKYFIDLTYVKNPTRIENLPEEGMTEFPEYMQYEIVNRAVELALENIESKRVQTKSQLNLSDE